MIRRDYPGDPERAREVQDAVARATGDPLPRHVEEPHEYQRALSAAIEVRL